MAPRERSYDAVIVGASLAGCAAAVQLGRAGFRVALVEKQPDPQAFKRVCTHIIQAGAVPALERLGLLEPMMAAGAVRTYGRAWTRWGWVLPPHEEGGASINLRRERLDPLVRDVAAATPGVELLLGRSAIGVLRDGERLAGVAVRDREGTEAELRARLVVGADGRNSPVAELAGLTGKTLEHGRCWYAAYFRDPAPIGDPDAVAWWLDPDFAVALPTDDGLVLYGVMPAKARIPDFKQDPGAALLSYMEALPDGPSIREAEQVGPTLGKLEMPNRVRGPVAPGLALIGDAALASDPLYGIGCGWAFQSAEWLAESVAPALRGEESLARGLSRYRRRHRRELRGHSLLIHDYATGRRFNWAERALYAGAARDPKLATAADTLYARRAKPGRLLARALPRAIAVSARHSLRRRGGKQTLTGDRAALRG